MKFFIFVLSMAILNIVSFFVNDNILGYINLVIACGCFFCSGMTLQRIADENNKKNIDWTCILFEVSFNVTIPKDGSDIEIDVLDDDYCQAYDYQRMLDSNQTFEPALIVKQQVEEWMEYLQENGVLSGHVKGEYI